MPVVRSQRQATATLGFIDRDVPVPSHICLFYHDDDELRRRLAFITVGLDDPKQAAVLFGKRERLEQVLGYIERDAHRDVAKDLGTARIALVEGAPTVDAALGNIAGALGAIVARGVQVIRFLGFIGWGEAAWPDPASLLEFEAQVTEAAKAYPAVVVCTYDAGRLPGALLLYGGIETHPLTILGTTLCENPHYVPLAAYLAADRAGERRLRMNGIRVGPLSVAPPEPATPGAVAASATGSRRTAPRPVRPVP